MVTDMCQQLMQTHITTRQQEIPKIVEVYLLHNESHNPVIIKETASNMKLFSAPQVGDWFKIPPRPTKRGRPPPRQYIRHYPHKSLSKELPWGGVLGPVVKVLVQPDHHKEGHALEGITSLYWFPASGSMKTDSVQIGGCILAVEMKLMFSHGTAPPLRTGPLS